MMREIKFRAWDRKLNIMWEPIELKKLLSYLIFQQMPNATAYTEIKDHFNDIEWLEYTGLHDKNGKEIFEGDILCHEDFIDSHRKNKCAGVMEWDEKDAGFVTFHPLEKFEVTGNIYEHPELLEGK